MSMCSQSQRRLAAASFAVLCLVSLACHERVADDTARRKVETSTTNAAPGSNKLEYSDILRQTRLSSADTTEVRLKTVQHWKRELLIPASRLSNLLVLVLTADESSWGKMDHDASFRTLDSFIDLIKSTRYPFDLMSLGLLTSSQSDFGNMKNTVEKVDFRKSHIIYHPGFGSTAGRSERHAEATQKDRRRSIARLRNYLMLRTLDSEEHVIWLDADVYWLPAGIIQNMIQQSLVVSGTTSRQTGIITARCMQADNNNYDLNAWLGSRSEPSAAQLYQAHDSDAFVPQPTQETKFMGQLVEGTKNDDLVPLDSVGGTILYMNSESIRQGLNFPTYYVVGTRWNSTEGWDGIETEGVCYIAKTLGYGCYGLGGTWVVKHTDG
ncbi:hypothetical protein ABBQ38_000744 [Trebouxia sp. C0009 RCD-2024]